MLKLLSLSLIFLAIALLTIDFSYGATYYCNSCSSCDQYFSNGTLKYGDTLKLTANMSTGGNCIKTKDEAGDNLIIDCQNHTVSGSGLDPDELFYFLNYSYITIKNCRFQNADQGVRFNGCNGCKITNNKIYSNGKGIEIENSNNISVTLNIIYNNGEGIYLSSVGSGEVGYNYIYNNGEWGIWHSNSPNVNIKFNRVCQNKIYGGMNYESNICDGVSGTCVRTCNTGCGGDCTNNSEGLCRFYCDGQGAYFPSEVMSDLNRCNIIGYVTQIYPLHNCHGKAPGYRFCDGNKVYDCAGCGGFHMVEDCAAQGKTCSNGHCVVYGFDNCGWNDAYPWKNMTTKQNCQNTLDGKKGCVRDTDGDTKFDQVCCADAANEINADRIEWSTGIGWNMCEKY